MNRVFLAQALKNGPVRVSPEQGRIARIQLIQRQGVGLRTRLGGQVDISVAHVSIPSLCALRRNQVREQAHVQSGLIQ